MNKLIKLVLSTLFLLSTVHVSAQPYWGTIFFGPDIITSADSSTYQSVTYTGQDLRTVYDRRIPGWVTINAYLFDVVWNDGLSSEAQINHEFGSIDAATAEAEKYAWSIGQLPTCLRVDVDAIWVHKGTEPFGGGNNSILIHTGQSTLYENDGILEETLVHEASHTSLDAAHAASSAWIEAQNQDSMFISNYAQDNPTSEDIAESFLTWVAIRHRSGRISQQDYDLITQAIPNRINYFDNIDCDMFPIVVEGTTPVAFNENSTEQNDLLVYPNPTSGLIQLKSTKLTTSKVRVLDAIGQFVENQYLAGNQQIDLSQLPGGLYFLEIRSDNHLFIRKVIKK